MTPDFLIVGVLHSPRNTRRHAWTLGGPDRCGKCRGCALPWMDCEYPGSRSWVAKLCGRIGGRINGLSLKRFVDELHIEGALPITSVDCKRCLEILQAHPFFSGMVEP